MSFPIREVAAIQTESVSREECIFMTEEIGSGEEILSCGNQWLPILWCYEIMDNSHKMERFRSDDDRIEEVIRTISDKGSNIQMSEKRKIHATTTTIEWKSSLE